MKTVHVLGIIAAFWTSSVFAQLGYANTDGLQVDVRTLGRFGDTRDLDCSIGIDLQGEKVASAATVSSARVLRAVDDTGSDLLRTNGWRSPSAPWTVMRTRSGFWLVFTLKSPATNAKSIRLLECEAQLSHGTSGPPQQPLRFSVSNIRLPWVDPPNMEVLVGSAWTFVPKPKNTQDRQFLLTLVGGRVPTATGMRELRIQRAEDEAGRTVTLEESRGFQGSRVPKFSPLEADHSIQRLVTLKAPAGKPARLGLLQGEAELCFASRTNGGIVDFDDFIQKKGEPLHNGALDDCKVKLTFVDRDNFATRKTEWQKNRPTIIGVLPKTAMPTNILDSLQFTFEDPEHRIIKLEFMDPNGETLPMLTEMLSTETLLPSWPCSRIFTFKSPPPAGTRLRVYLAAPAAMVRVPFKVANVPL